MILNGAHRPYAGGGDLAFLAKWLEAILKVKGSFLTFALCLGLVQLAFS